MTFYDGKKKTWTFLDEYYSVNSTVQQIIALFVKSKKQNNHQKRKKQFLFIKQILVYKNALLRQSFDKCVDLLYKKFIIYICSIAAMYIGFAILYSSILTLFN